MRQDTTCCEKYSRINSISHGSPLFTLKIFCFSSFPSSSFPFPFYWLRVLVSILWVLFVFHLGFDFSLAVPGNWLVCVSFTRFTALHSSQFSFPSALSLESENILQYFISQVSPNMYNKQTTWIVIQIHSQSQHLILGNLTKSDNLFENDFLF